MEFEKGNKVKIVGPSICGQTRDIGREFVIYQIFPNSGAKLYTNGQEYNYPASSLQLVEDKLKISDWVRVVGPDYNNRNEEHGECFQIESFTAEYGWYSALGMNFYPAKSLRKLNPEEIAQHTQPDWYQCKGCLRMNEMDRRVSDIEKKQNNIYNEKPEVNNRIICPHARFSPHQKSMFCGSEGFILCHDNLVKGVCPLLSGR